MTTEDLALAIRQGVSVRRSSIADLARENGLARDTIERWMRGKHLDRIAEFLTLAESLGLELKRQPGFYAAGLRHPPENRV